MKNQRIIGGILILTGALILAHQLNWFDLSSHHIIGILSILIGLSFYRKASFNPERKGALGGTFFLIFGLALLFLNVPRGIYARALLVGLIFVSLAVANLVYFVVSNWKKNLNLFMFFFFMAIGIPILLVYYQVWDVWQFREIAETYWPIILIILGLIILFDSLWQKRKNFPEEKPEKPLEKKDLPG